MSATYLSWKLLVQKTSLNPEFRSGGNCNLVRQDSSESILGIKKWGEIWNLAAIKLAEPKHKTIHYSGARQDKCSDAVMVLGLKKMTGEIAHKAEIRQWVFKKSASHHILCQ